MNLIVRKILCRTKSGKAENVFFALQLGDKIYFSARNLRESLVNSENVSVWLVCQAFKKFRVTKVLLKSSKRTSFKNEEAYLYEYVHHRLIRATWAKPSHHYLQSNLLHCPFDVLSALCLQPPDPARRPSITQPQTGSTSLYIWSCCRYSGGEWLQKFNCKQWQLALPI